MGSEFFFQDLPANQLHAREMKGTFPHVAFERAGDTTVPVEISVPLAKLRIFHRLVQDLGRYEKDHRHRECQ